MKLNNQVLCVATIVLLFIVGIRGFFGDRFEPVINGSPAFANDSGGVGDGCVPIFDSQNACSFCSDIQPYYTLDKSYPGLTSMCTNSGLATNLSFEYGVLPNVFWSCVSDANCSAENYYCGDGMIGDGVSNSYGEECDDGDSVDDNDCANDCTQNFTRCNATTLVCEYSDDSNLPLCEVGIDSDGDGIVDECDVCPNSSPTPPPVVDCRDDYQFDTSTCTWINQGTQDPMPSAQCYETVTFNDTACVWEVIGTQPSEPVTACYESTLFNSATCVWDVTGMQPAEPATTCYETAAFNAVSCVRDITTDSNLEPGASCVDTAGSIGTMNNVCTCICTDTDNDGACDTVDQCPTDPNKIDPLLCGCGLVEGSCQDCNGEANGTAVIDSCGECVGGNTGEVSDDSDGDGVLDCTDVCISNAYNTANGAPANYNANCNQTSAANVCGDVNTTNGNIICDGTCNASIPSTPVATDTDNDGTPDCIDSCPNVSSNVSEKPPTVNCRDNYQFDPATCVWINQGNQDPIPNLLCYENAGFDNVTCAREVTTVNSLLPGSSCTDMQGNAGNIDNSCLCIGGCVVDSDCADTNICTDDVCNAGVCENTIDTTNDPSCVVGGCVVDSDCADTNICTDDVCNAGVCENTIDTTNDSSCDICLINADCMDGILCNDDVCTGGVCNNPTDTTNNSSCQPCNLSLTVSPTICDANNNINLGISVNGSVGNISYTILDSNNIQYSGFSVPSGQYTVLASDDAIPGCTDSKTIGVSCGGKGFGGPQNNTPQIFLPKTELEQPSSTSVPSPMPDVVPVEIISNIPPTLRVSEFVDGNACYDLYCPVGLDFEDISSIQSGMIDRVQKEFCLYNGSLNTNRFFEPYKKVTYEQLLKIATRILGLPGGEYTGFGQAELHGQSLLNSEMLTPSVVTIAMAVPEAFASRVSIAQILQDIVIAFEMDPMIASNIYMAAGPRGETMTRWELLTIIDELLYQIQEFGPLKQCGYISPNVSGGDVIKLVNLTVNQIQGMNKDVMLELFYE